MQYQLNRSLGGSPFQFDGSTLLVTGGTGSFGRTFIKRCLKTNVAEIRVLSRDESKQDEMRRELCDKRLRFFIGDVRDPAPVDDAMRGVDHVFHAAALKQVPSCEFHPMEAVKTNVMGAENVMRSAVEHEVRVCVVLSTDKAVQPVNTMGLTKALMEKLMIARSRISGDRTVLCATRYGNVMGSRGSVIPLFREQLLAGKPITITNPAMTRFLLSLEESVELVLTAFSYARSGDIFVRKAPACTVGDLATAMQQAMGRSGTVRIIGTRHGEKLHETLVSAEEMARSEDMGDYFRIRADHRDLNYGTVPVTGVDGIFEDYTSLSTTQLAVPQIVDLLKPMVAEPAYA
jgi:UDP-N-acetylglucosamine 4,6-dehydratase